MYKFKDLPLKDIKRNLKKAAKSEKLTLSVKQEQYARANGFVSWANLILHIKNNFSLPIAIMPRCEGVDFPEPVTITLTKEKNAIAVAGDLGDGKTFIAIDVLHQAISQGWEVEFIGVGEITDDSAAKYLDHRLIHNYRNMDSFTYSPFFVSKDECISFESRANEPCNEKYKLVILEQAGRILSNEAVEKVVDSADAALFLTQGEPHKPKSKNIEQHFLTKGALNRAKNWNAAISQSLC